MQAVEGSIGEHLQRNFKVRMIAIHLDHPDKLGANKQYGEKSVSRTKPITEGDLNPLHNVFVETRKSQEKRWIEALRAETPDFPIEDGQFRASYIGPVKVSMAGSPSLDFRIQAGAKSLGDAPSDKVLTAAHSVGYNR